MKSITVSSDVFAAIWKAHEEGEETEDAILRRIFKLPPTAPAEFAGIRPHVSGFYDERSGVHFPEGTMIFRVYKGFRREAWAAGGRWLVKATGKSYHSLHKLSQSVNNNGNENAWLNWKFIDNNHREHLIDELRKNPALLSPRTK